MMHRFSNLFSREARLVFQATTPVQQPAEAPKTGEQANKMAEHLTKLKENLDKDDAQKVVEDFVNRLKGTVENAQQAVMAEKGDILKRAAQTEYTQQKIDMTPEQAAKNVKDAFALSGLYVTIKNDQVTAVSETWQPDNPRDPSPREQLLKTFQEGTAQDLKYLDQAERGDYQAKTNVLLIKIAHATNGKEEAVTREIAKRMRDEAADVKSGGDAKLKESFDKINTGRLQEQKEQGANQLQEMLTPLKELAKMLGEIMKAFNDAVKGVDSSNDGGAGGGDKGLDVGGTNTTNTPTETSEPPDVAAVRNEIVNGDPRAVPPVPPGVIAVRQNAIDEKTRAEINLNAAAPGSIKANLANQELQKTAANTAVRDAQERLNAIPEEGAAKEAAKTNLTNAQTALNTINAEIVGTENLKRQEETNVANAEKKLRIIDQIVEGDAKKVKEYNDQMAKCLRDISPLTTPRAMVLKAALENLEMINDQKQIIQMNLAEYDNAEWEKVKTMAGKITGIDKSAFNVDNATGTIENPAAFIEELKKVTQGAIDENKVQEVMTEKGVNQIVAQNATDLNNKYDLGLSYENNSWNVKGSPTQIVKALQSADGATMQTIIRSTLLNTLNADLGDNLKNANNDGKTLKLIFSELAVADVNNTRVEQLLAMAKDTNSPPRFAQQIQVKFEGGALVITYPRSATLSDEDKNTLRTTQLVTQGRIDPALKTFLGI